MIHYSCDRCRRPINSDTEIRYLVTIETQAAIDSPHSDADDSRDHLSELHELLERLDDEQRAEISMSAYQSQRFDLCSDCHRQFMKHPLGSDLVSQLDFSDN